MFFSSAPQGQRKKTRVFLPISGKESDLRSFFSPPAVENRKRFSTAGEGPFFLEKKNLGSRKERSKIFLYDVFSNSFGIRENEGLLNMYIFFFANVQIFRIWTFVSFILTARHANVMNGFAGACLRRIREIRDRSLSGKRKIFDLSFAGNERSWICLFPFGELDKSVIAQKRACSFLSDLRFFNRRFFLPSKSEERPSPQIPKESEGTRNQRFRKKSSPVPRVPRKSHAIFGRQE